MTEAETVVAAIVAYLRKKRGGVALPIATAIEAGDWKAHLPKGTAMNHDIECSYCGKSRRSYEVSGCFSQEQANHCEHYKPTPRGDTKASEPTEADCEFGVVIDLIVHLREAGYNNWARLVADLRRRAAYAVRTAPPKESGQ